MASLLNPPKTSTSTSDRIAQNLNGGARMEEEPKESCRFKMSHSNALNGCPADCATLFPAIPGQCLCPRNTKDDCETDKGCHWSVDAQTEGKCIHQMDRLYNALFRKLDKRGNTTGILKLFLLAAAVLQACNFRRRHRCSNVRYLFIKVIMLATSVSIELLEKLREC